VLAIALGEIDLALAEAETLYRTEDDALASVPEIYTGGLALLEAVDTWDGGSFGRVDLNRAVAVPPAVGLRIMRPARRASFAQGRVADVVAHRRVGECTPGG